MGLSRKSALNDRYFEKEKQRSRSLDNLLQSEIIPSPVKLANLGLSSSKLNERYHSLERIGETPAVSNVEYMTRTEITQERKYSRVTRTTEPNIEEEDLTIDFEYPDIQSVSQTGRSEDDKSYIRSQTRFIKSQYPGKSLGEEIILLNFSSCFERFFKNFIAYALRHDVSDPEFVLYSRYLIRCCVKRILLREFPS